MLITFGDQPSIANDKWSRKPTQDQDHEIWDGQGEEVVVGGRVHRLVLDDDEADGDVADDAGDEDADVEERQRDEQRQTHVFGTQDLEEKSQKYH